MTRRVGVALLALLVLGVALTAFSATSRFSRSRSILKQDGMAYFMYTRSLVVDLDTDVTAEIDQIRRFDEDATEAIDRYVAVNPSTGRVELPWPVGIAFVMAPFYTVGWLVELGAATVSGRAPDTFGVIPITFYALGCVLLACLGVWWTIRACRGVADRDPATIAALAVALGGPLVFYTFFHPTMVHSASFGLMAGWTLLWQQGWRERPRWALLGGLLGLLVAMRYQNVMFGVLLLALVIHRGRAEGARPAIKGAAMAAAGGAAVLSLQVIHLIINHGLFTGATHLSEEPGSIAGNVFDFTSPYILHVLFSPKHGAFYWAPVLAIGFGGLLAAAVQRQTWAAAAVATILAHVWLIGTLGEINWSGAAAFGMRYLTECTPLFALGLAVLLQASGRRLRRAWIPALGALVAFNLALTVPYSLRVISQEEAVTWPEMARGIGRSVGAIRERLGSGQ